MKKKRIRKIWLVLLLVVMLSAYPSFLMVKLTSKDYSFKSSYKIIINNLHSFALNNSYSETFENAVLSKDFNKSNINKYIKIKYYNQTDYIKTINTLIKIGYSTDDINLFNEKLTYKNVLSISSRDKIDNLDKYIIYDYFSFKDLDRYLAYYNKTNDYSKTIIYVNIGLDKEMYKDAVNVEKYSETMIANKYNKLDEKFVPPNIVNISSNFSNGEQTLEKVAKEAFEKMCDDALIKGLYLIANSSYRSYNSQQEVYNYYYKNYGSAYTKKYVATPGYSEHQTGLAIDIGSKKTSIFKNSKEYSWIINNAHNYGFILRYPEGKESITGYNAEAWHFRYVGKDIATYIWNNKLTYEEYYAMFLYKEKE